MEKNKKQYQRQVVTKEELKPFFADNLFVFADRFQEGKNFYVSGQMISLSADIITILNKTTGKVQTFKFSELKHVSIARPEEPESKKDHMKKYREYYD